MRRRHRVVGVLASVVVGLLVVGCSSPERHEPRRPIRGSAAQQEAPGRPAPPATAPAGFRSVGVPSAGIRLAVPQDMTVVDPAVLASGDAGEVLDELMGRVGMTHEQAEQALEQCELYAIAPDGSNVNVMVIDSRRLPTTGEVTATLNQMGVTDLQLTRRTTGVGDALTARGALSVAAGVTVYQHDLWAQSGAVVVSVGVTTPTEAPLDELFEAVLGSLEPLG